MNNSLIKPIFGEENIRNKILNLLKKNNVDFKHLKHKPALTSDEGVAMTNIPKEKGIKSLILRGKKTGKNYLVAVLGHQKLNMKAVSSLIEEKCELEDLRAIQEHFGIKQGGASPFGNLLGLETFFDESILELNECIIGCGLPTESIIMQAKDLVRLIQPKICKIIKE